MAPIKTKHFYSLSVLSFLLYCTSHCCAVCQFYIYIILFDILSIFPPSLKESRLTEASRNSLLVTNKKSPPPPPHTHTHTHCMFYAKAYQVSCCLLVRAGSKLTSNRKPTVTNTKEVVDGIALECHEFHK
jgi:hypothetical protein